MNLKNLTVKRNQRSVIWPREPSENLEFLVRVRFAGRDFLSTRTDAVELELVSLNEDFLTVIPGSINEALFHSTSFWMKMFLVVIYLTNGSLKKKKEAMVLLISNYHSVMIGCKIGSRWIQIWHRIDSNSGTRCLLKKKKNNFWVALLLPNGEMTSRFIVDSFILWFKFGSENEIEIEPCVLWKL